MKKIKSALISVYHKEGLELIIKELSEKGVQLISTGGTHDYIKELGYEVTKVEDITDYPSILGGRVKTIHPKIFGGILSRRHKKEDREQIAHYTIPEIDLVIVDLYPFEETVASGASQKNIIEKIDIGGISLIRAAAKNYKDVVVVPSSAYYEQFLTIFNNKGGCTDLTDRHFFAGAAFNVSSHYDTAIFNFFNTEYKHSTFKQSFIEGKTLRYGENPHQKGFYYGSLTEVFEQIHGKEISYNNLLDLDAAINLINEFKTTTFAILKHNNACGIASRKELSKAYEAALAGDPISAFGGVLITNKTIGPRTAEKINKLFFEIIAAPGFEKKSLEILKQKKNRVILHLKSTCFKNLSSKSVLNGVLVQDCDRKVVKSDEWSVVTKEHPTGQEADDLAFANKIVKHTKSNAIVLVKGQQLLASGTGQTSRVDALKQAIEKAKENGFSLSGAVMASDAFFPFPDCVELAHQAGITAVIQPGGSINDQASIDYCNNRGMAMVMTGNRHFKH